MRVVQPVNNPVMGAVEQKLVHDTVDAHGPADQLQRCIIRVAEDEVVAVKGSQLRPADAARQGGHVVDVGLVDHGGHGFLDAAVGKLVARVIVPDGLEVEVGPAHQRLHEGQRPGVCDCCCARVVVCVCWDGEVGCVWGSWVGVDGQVLPPWASITVSRQMRERGSRCPPVWAAPIQHRCDDI